MASPTLLPVLPPLASAVFSAAVGAYCARRRTRPGASAFVVIAWSEAAWMVGYAAELLSPGVAGKTFWDNLQYLPAAVLAVALLAFAHAYSGRLPRRPRLVYGVLAAPLLLLALLAFTDPWHGLVRSATRTSYPTLSQLRYDFTWVEPVAGLYIWALQAATVATLAAAWRGSHRLYRRQVNAVLAGILIPVLGSVATLTVLADQPWRDITPWTFALSNLVIAWGLFRGGLFDVAPIARHAVVESMADAVYVLDADGRVVDLNPAAAKAAGLEVRALAGRPAAEVLPLPAGVIAALVADGEAPREVETTGPAPYPAEPRVRPLRGPRGEPWGTALVLRDVSERKRVEQELRGHRAELERLVAERTGELRQSEQSLRQIAESSRELFWLMEADGRVAYLSPAFERMWGVPREAVLRDTEAALAVVAPEDREIVRTLLAEGALRPAEATYRVLHADGSEHWLLTRATPVRDEQGALYRLAGVTEDITERKRLEDQLVHDAFHDALTGLPNRALFQDRLQHAVDLYHRHPDRGFAVMILDLDRFKLVNDSFGHLAGDRLLVEVAARLRLRMREGDTVARFGGDEFALLIDDVPDAGEALRAAERVQAELWDPFTLEGQSLYVTPSIGIALSGPEVERPEDLVRRADTAMYRAKELGGARCELFGREMHARALQRLRTETELRQALEREEFEVWYQPIVALPAGRVAGFEALVRWRHPERGLLAPADFLETAEDTGLVVALDRWVLHAACRQLRRWRDRYTGSGLRVTVNLSGKQFLHPGLLAHIEATLAETGVDVDWLRLEITEGALVGRAEEKLLSDLRARGVQMLIDDFGTGYSSLGYLHRLPISALKVDRAFMRGGAANFAIVGAVVTLAHNLEKEVVVEGVETAEQLERVCSFAADYAQGYLFAPPVPAAEAEQFIERQFRDLRWQPLHEAAA